MGEIVDQPMLFCQRNEARGFDPSKLGVVPPDQRLYTRQSAVAQRDFWLIHQAQPLLRERAFEAHKQAYVGLAAHITSVARSWLRTVTRSSSRTGFSTGPAIVRPSASPRRKADSRTRRSNPLTIRTGER